MRFDWMTVVRTGRERMLVDAWLASISARPGNETTNQRQAYQGKTGCLMMIDDPTFTFRFKPPFDVSNAANKATDDCLNEAVNLEAAQK